MTTATAPVRLSLEGSVEKITAPDSSVDEVVANHCLELVHTSQAAEYVADLFRVLRPGGRVRVVVTDFGAVAAEVCRLAKDPKASTSMPVMGLLYGTPEKPVRSAFNEDGLCYVLARAGFVAMRRSSSGDTEIAVEAIKPTPVLADNGRLLKRIGAVATMPRFGSTDTAKDITLVCERLGIPYIKSSGAYYDMGIERAITAAIEAGYEYILTIDYDGGFGPEHVVALATYMEMYPEADAIAPLQIGRESTRALFFKEDGANQSELDKVLIPVKHAHFGLTMLRAKSFEKMTRPWFHHTPDPKTGWWTEDRVDADVAFWLKWTDVGNTVFLAPRLAIGHLQLVMTWPTHDMQVIHQSINDYEKNGPPKNARIGWL